MGTPYSACDPPLFRIGPYGVWVRWVGWRWSWQVHEFMSPGDGVGMLIGGLSVNVGRDLEI